MKVIKISEVKLVEGISKLFTGGNVNRQVLIDEKIAQQLKVMMISFSPGARTKFHTHTFEQVLYVTEGKGVVATEKEEHVVTPGVIAYIPVGERHWHGATEDTSFSHISIITPGETTF